jgi:plastocyanin
LEQSNAFVPDNLSVKVGTTVYWINLDAPAGGDAEIHNVIFTSGATVTSPDMHQYDVYSYTFTAPGTYKYFCSYHPSSMQATITVTP